MYETYFKFSARPFLATPDIRRYVPTTLIEEGRQALLRIIERGEGPGVVIGAAGTGKSLLCQLLAADLADRLAVALLVSGRFLRRRELLQAILHELGLPYRGLEEGELRLSLLDALGGSASGGDGLLLIVDEAHTLNYRLLEEIRLLTNLVRGGTPRVRVVLAGNGLLEERFNNPKLSSFSQRLAARVYLEPLNASETSQYVRAQINSVGGDASRLVDDDALRAIHRATDGTPRLINQVCDHALILTALAGERQLTARVIEEAWADSQRLPSPWTQPEHTARADEVIEFGGLDDRADDRVTAIPFPAKAQLLQLNSMDACDFDASATDEPLAELDPDFHATEPTGTEVELDFPEFGDPFNEQFEQEEVVLDRYGAEAELFEALPRVTCPESRPLVALLAAWTSSTPVIATPPPSRIAEPCVEIAGQAPVATLATAPTWCMADAGALTLPSVSVSGPLRASREPAVLPSKPTTPLGHSLSQLAPRDERSGGIIVVEDAAPQHMTPPQPHTGAANRKREFRQLFARLRRD